MPPESRSDQTADTLEWRIWFGGAHFDALCDRCAALMGPSPTGERRTDAYLVTGNPAIGLKKRGGDGAGWEMKVLLDRMTGCRPPLDLWRKFALVLPDEAGRTTVKVQKQRRLWHPVPDSPLVVEAAHIQMAGREYSSFCVEAAGRGEIVAGKAAEYGRAFLSPEWSGRIVAEQGYPAMLNEIYFP